MDTPIISSSTKKQNRKPNCKCVVCGKPLYRRPFELKKVRHVACMAHRGEAQRLLGLTQAQKDALDLGRQKGTNHLEGIPKSETSKQKRSEAMKKWAVNNPDKVKARGEKTKRENHYNWKGGARLFSHLVRDQAGKKWSNAVKERDKVCVHCGGSHRLESHHIIPLSVLVKQYGITTIEEARQYADILWNIDNGIALCRICHYKAHGKKYNSK